MNQLPKSIFIGTYPVTCFVALIVSIQHLITGFNLTAFGLLLTAVPMLFLLAIVFMTDVARTNRHLTNYSVLVFAGFLMVLYGSVEGNEIGLLQILSVFTFLGWILYVWWYSVFQNRNNPELKAGNKLLTFTVEDESGNQFSSSNFEGNKNIILFFRGNWCPLCMAQIKEIAAKYKELEAKGIQTILISPQPHRNTKALAKKFDVGFKFFVDKDNKAAKALKIAAKNGLPLGLQALGYDSDTVMPTIILTDEQGKVLYSDLTANYRIRPEPDHFLKFFDL